MKISKLKLFNFGVKMLALLKLKWFNFNSFIKKVFIKSSDEMNFFDDDRNSLFSHDPFVLQFQNDTTELLKGILLGANKFLLSQNFGNDNGIKIINLQGSDYAHLLVHLINKKITLMAIRIESSSDIENLKQTIKFCDSYPDGRSIIRPIDLKKFYSEDQVIDYIIDVKREFELSSNSHFEFTIQPNSIITFSLFPVKIK